VAVPTIPTVEEHWTCDVLIVGAGPAGTAAAIEAARRGLNAVIIDKARFPRDKCCGDGLTAGALRHLEEIGLDPNVLPSWVTVADVHLRSPSGRKVSLPLPRGQGTYAAVCRRRELDGALVDLARRQGVTVLEGHELRGVSSSHEGVVAEVDGIKFSCSYLIAADGMWSPTRKLLGIATDNYRGEWHAFRQYFTSVSAQASSQLVVWFEPDLLPGYAWSFPLGDGAANVGFGIQRGQGQSVQAMGKLWPELLKRDHIANFLGPDACPESPHRAWPIPAKLGRGPLTKNRVLFAGDAAMATDPMTGEGIGQALMTGRAAVHAIVEAGCEDPQEAALHYRRALRRELMHDHLLARWLSAAMGRRSVTTAAVALVDTNDWTRRNFARWLFEDYPRALAFTPRRWHREMFGAPGAFNRTMAN